jgi:hypothetical protein
MRQKGWLVLGLATAMLSSAWGIAYSQAPKVTRIAGVDWEPSLQRAQARAKREGKPIFLLHMFGRLDQEFC